MNPVVASLIFTVALFAGMLILLETGRRWGIRRLASDPGCKGESLGAIEGAVFALLGLLIAFTFSGAASRFDDRRKMIVEETNNIGTAWLRIDLLPAAAQPALRDSFRRYVDSRIEVYRDVTNATATGEALARSTALQGEIWTRATAASLDGAAPSAPMLLLPALNSMYDITTTRLAAISIHPPVVIFAMLGAVALISSLLAGYGMAGGKVRSWIHMAGFAAITAGAVYVILDLEFPRLGLIRVDSFDQLLVDLRASMK